MRPFFLFLLLLTLFAYPLSAQKMFTRADTLRGMLTPLRTCFDVTFYDLEVKIAPETQRIAGQNIIHFTVRETFDFMQIDLFQELEIVRILFEGKPVPFSRDFNAVFIRLPRKLAVGQKGAITVVYGGKPREARRPPWDGGVVWRKDAKGFPRVSVACEGLGASLWYPLKDHLSDEPDSMRISLLVPEGLTGVSNGVLRAVTPVPGGYQRFEWVVSYPINSYNATFYAGRYAHIHDTYASAYGNSLDLDYFVFPENEATARQYFDHQVKPMLACFEKYFGPYAFPRDGYALVETDFWGMEHQGAIAYGNEYRLNKYGFDFIIVHETGHEWFGNSLSVRDHGEMWIHEAFTTYMEAVYVEDRQGEEQMLNYLAEQRAKIVNKEPVLGPLNVNYCGWKDADMYYKGTWLLQTLRYATGNDELWFATLKAFANTYRISPVGTEETIRFFNEHLRGDYTWLFNQYLRYKEVPVLEYRIAYAGEDGPADGPESPEKSGRKKKKPADEQPGKTLLGGIRMTLYYRWRTPADFPLTVQATIGGEKMTLKPTRQWQSVNQVLKGETSFEFNTREALFDVERLE